MKRKRGRTNRQPVEEQHPTFAANLRFWRKLSGLSTRELADTAGISRQSVNNFELGLYMPNYDTVCRLAEGVSVPVEYLWNILPALTAHEDDVRQ